ncbi:unnamed protein product [Phyllotreta striolata]|uniref:Apolipoprotein D n=1 Tax=Phyllotreta striolata TaxID=444603 RepID=A0A9N9TQ79_PHYSR|nr:unnamed protein product [Phyllotreta striolata]
MLVYILLIAIISLQNTSAQIPSLTHDCPKVNVVQNFNVSAYLGKWYEQEKYPIIFELGGECITAEYTLKDDGTVKVFNKMTVAGFPSSIEGSATLNSTTGEAKLVVTFNVPIAVHSPYWVLSTDYTSYAVVWSCQDVLVASASTAWILTRDQNPPRSLIEKAENILKQQNISTTPLTKTNQNNCKK